LVDAASDVTAPAQRTSPAPWPLIIGLSVSSLAVLGGVAYYLTTNNGQQASVIQSPESRIRPLENRKSPVVASNEEVSELTQESASFGPTNSVGDPENSRSASKNVQDSIKRHPAIVNAKPSLDTPAPLASERRAEAPERPPQNPAQKPGAEVPVSIVRDLSPDERIRELGLERLGNICVLTEEADLQKQFNETRARFAELRSNVEKRIAIEQTVMNIRELDQAFPELDFKISELRRWLGQRPARPNNVEKDFYDGIKEQLDAFDEQRNLNLLRVKQLRSQLPAPSERNAIDVAIARDRDWCRSALEDLVAKIKSADAKFENLKKDDRVRKALDRIGTTKIDHMPGYENAPRQIKQWEAFLKSTTAKMEPKTEPVSKKSPGMRQR
jgi:hypothetical protein